MRKLITTTFVTVDGVMQAPGGPEEDTSGGFKYGGWTVNYWDEMMGAVMNDFIARPFELLLGRRTYDIFAAHWPYSKEEPIATRFNSTRKWVVSDHLAELSWHNSKLITGDVIALIIRLKELNDPDLWVHGSSYLIQSLLSNNLIDTMHLWIFPITVGGGKRLFAEGTQAQGFKLIESKISTTGVIVATYESAGSLKTGSFASESPSEEELIRRKKMHEGTW